MATAERPQNVERQVSVCTISPRRSTNPGFGVSSASAISACRARRASQRAVVVSFTGFRAAERTTLDNSCIMTTNSEARRRAVETSGPGDQILHVLRGEERTLSFEAANTDVFRIGHDTPLPQRPGLGRDRLQSNRAHSGDRRKGARLSSCPSAL